MGPSGTDGGSEGTAGGATHLALDSEQVVGWITEIATFATEYLPSQPPSEGHSFAHVPTDDSVPPVESAGQALRIAR
eukprot:3323916-Pyramimonas_sp.AAC.1